MASTVLFIIHGILLTDEGRGTGGALSQAFSQAFSQRAFTAPDIVLAPEYRYNAYICNEKSHFRYELPEKGPQAEDVSISKFGFYISPVFAAVLAAALVPV